MNKILYLIFFFFITSCANLNNLSEYNIDDINLNPDDILSESWEVDVIDSTSEDDIDELIDILFNVNIN